MHVLLRTLGLMAVASFFLITPVAAQSLILYDDFASGVLDPAKWSGTSLEGGFNNPSLETVREITNGQLRLKLTSWGNTFSDTGTIQSRSGLIMKQIGASGDVSGLNATLTVMGAKAQNCPVNTAGGSARAQLFGFFFNDGTGPDPTSNVGNIIARIQLQKDSDGGNRIAAFLSRCVNVDCSQADVIVMPGNPVIFATTWSLNTPIDLKLLWQADKERFQFTAGAEVKKIPYTGLIANAGPPVPSDTKQVRVQNFAENCAAGPRKIGMDVLFDNIRVRQ